MKLKPLADRVVIKMLEAEETTKGGIGPPGCCVPGPPCGGPCLNPPTGGIGGRP